MFLLLTVGMVLSDVEYKHEVLAYGVLVREEEDYEFLNDVIRSNRFVLGATITRRWKKMHEQFFQQPTPGLFDASRPHFQVAFVALVGGIVVISIAGGIYEYLRRNQFTWSKM